MADLPFPPISRTLVGVTHIQYGLIDPDPDSTDQQSMTYSSQLKWSDGSFSKQGGSVVPHLTPAEISGLQSLLARLRAKAEAAWGDA